MLNLYVIPYYGVLLKANVIKYVLVIPDMNLLVGGLSKYFMVLT